MDKTIKHTLLFVDDEESITKAIYRLFRRDGYHIITAAGGPEGLTLLKNVNNPVSLIISDQRMPGMNGAEFLEKSREIFPDAIRFLLTGYSDMDAVVDAVNKGEIHKYLTKPWNDEDLKLQVRQALSQYELVMENRRLTALTLKQNRELNELNKGLETKVRERTAEIIKKQQELESANEKLGKSFKEAVRLLASLADSMNPDLGKYMRHVAALSVEIAKDMGISGWELDTIELAGMIHDIGLLGYSEKFTMNIGNKMKKDDFEIFTQHPVIASLSLEPVEKLKDVAEIILYHHESFNGDGFPSGLSGENIPLGARILCPVSDYCKIVDMWPKDPNGLSKMARSMLGKEAGTIAITDGNKMLQTIAEKALLMGSHEKYDIQIVTLLMQKVRDAKSATRRSFWVKLEKLEEGMVLEDDLRLKEGKLLLTGGTVLNMSSIKAIQSIGLRGLIEEKLFISIKKS